jgi:AcrR family transcriptional regulator
MGARSDTRSKIQDAALDLFGEQGYDKTSLREIAEALGVTKAALYYHFKTKEEIIVSLLQASHDRLDEVAAWLEKQEPTPENRREVVRRYAEAMNDGGRAFTLMRLIQENQPALRELMAGMKAQDRMQTIFQFLTDPDASLADQLKARMSIVIMHAGMFAMRDLGATAQERHNAALQVGLELIG